MDWLPGQVTKILLFRQSVGIAREVMLEGTMYQDFTDVGWNTVGRLGETGGSEGVVHPGLLTLREAAHVAFRIMRLGVPEHSVSAISQELAEYFYDHFRVLDPAGPGLLAARVYAVLPWRQIAPERQQYYQSLRSEDAAVAPDTLTCLLLGTCGQYGEWCRPALAGADQCRIAESNRFAQSRPIVEQVLSKLDDNLDSWVSWEGAGLLEDLDRAVTVVHVETPCEDVVPSRMPTMGGVSRTASLRSVIGLGVRLPSGRQIVVELLCVVPLSPQLLAQYRVVALSIYLAFLQADLTWQVPTELSEGTTRCANSPAVVFQHVLTAKMQGQERILALFHRATDEREGANGAAELRCLLNRLIMTEDLQRRQLALDLHDEVTAKVGAVVFAMGSLLASPPLEGGAVLEEVARYRHELIELSRWARLKSHELHPAVLTQLGLVDAVKRLALEWSHRVGIPVGVHVKGQIETGQDPIVSTTVYRVLQECLRNVEKHARATQVTVKLWQEGIGVRVSVHDNGVGFCPIGARQRLAGIGLVGMAERIRMIRGTFWVDSGPGEGTRVELLVPHQVLIREPFVPVMAEVTPGLARIRH